MFVLQAQNGWLEVAQTEKGPLAAMSRYGVPIMTVHARHGRACEPRPRWRAQLGLAFRKSPRSGFVLGETPIQGS